MKFLLKIKGSYVDKFFFLTKKRNEKISIYLCGPTVYEETHIGNLRGILLFDVISRIIRRKNKIDFVHNITDIDDKIIERALSEKQSEIFLTNHYTSKYLKVISDMKLYVFPKIIRVTDCINDNIFFVDELFKKNKLNIKNGDLLFKSKIKNKQFAVWKKTTSGRSWETRWGRGRPGWHTECAVIIDKHFQGETIDLHGGGIDLKFPHHENENLLFFAKNNKPISSCWIHHGQVIYSGKKMSKRHGNIIYSSTFIENYGINVLKFLILNCSHSKPLTVTVEKVNEIQQIINKYFSLLRKVNFFLVLGKFSFLGKKENKKEITNYCEILRNGLNFPKYFKRLQSMFKKLNYLMITVDIFNFKSVFSKNIDEIVTYFFHFRRMFWFLGIEFKVYYHFKKKHEKIINDWIFHLKNKNYSLADEKRETLKKMFGEFLWF